MATLCAEERPTRPATIDAPPVQTVPDHAILHLDVTVHHQGPQPFTISALRPGCGCTTATVSAMEIPAGGSVILHAAIDNRGRSGAYDSEVVLVSGHPDLPDLSVPLRWQVQGAVTTDRISTETSPQPIGRPTRQLDRNRDLFLIDTTSLEASGTHLVARLGSDRPPTDGLQVRVLQADPPWQTNIIPQTDGSWLLRMTVPAGTSLAGGSPEQPRTDRVVVGTNHPDRPTVTFRIMALTEDR